MPTYMEYKTEDGSIVLVEHVKETGGVVRASRNGINVMEKASGKTKA